MNVMHFRYYRGVKVICDVEKRKATKNGVVLMVLVRWNRACVILSVRCMYAR